jgi:hypothetical protein
MIIINKQPRLVIIQLLNDKRRNYDHKLMPGVNEIPAEDWRRTIKGVVPVNEKGEPRYAKDDPKGRARVNPVIQQMLDNDLLEVPEVQPEGTGLTGLKGSDAAGLVRRTFDINQLKAYHATEQRPKLKAIIEEQIEKIEAKKVMPEDQE